MAWICTVDVTNEGARQCDQGVPIPPRVGRRSRDYRKGMRMPFHWRCLDDDGNVYYAGLSSCDPNDAEEEIAFAPLDDFALPDAGAVEIQYFNPDTGEWETL